MEKEKINYSLIEEPKTALPKRGGNYISDKSKQEKREKRNRKMEALYDEIDNLRDQLHQYDKHDDGPFHWGEGSC